ncbi:hypothetical protein ISCGN_007024 [Ixodes scapularis]
MHLQANGVLCELVMLDGLRARNFHVARSLLRGRHLARWALRLALRDSTGHTPVSLLAVSRTSRPNSPGNVFLYSRTHWRSSACTLSRFSHNESSKTFEQERYLSLLRKTPSSQNQPVPHNLKTHSGSHTDEQ